MIGRLVGVIAEITDDGWLLVDVGGVGYEVAATAACRKRFGVGIEATVVIRSLTRDDGTWLYGFVDADERRCFDELRTVQGVGPSVALAILSMLGPEGVVNAIVTQDAKRFREVPGVGPRLSERLVLEMKHFVEGREVSLVPDVPEIGGAMPSERDERVREALSSLGFTSIEIVAATKDLPGELSEGEAVRRALRSLTR
ncbi:MAG: Holliday junction branch migration protein RuvA [Acidimicrobiales bacterium]